MIKVLDLGAGTQSVRKALTEMYEIHSWHLKDGHWYGYNVKQNMSLVDYVGIDIYSPEQQNIIIDLASEFTLDMLLDRLNSWKPNFIWNSPLCKAFSTAPAYVGGNLYFEKVGEDDFKVREQWNDASNRRYTIENCKKKKEQYQAFARMSLTMHKNTMAIIDYYKVPFALENPAKAMSRYMYKKYIRNVCSYCQYGFDYQKDTAIYTNKPLNLMKCNHKGKHPRSMSGKIQGVKTYAEKSSVPPKLIKEIITQLLKGEINERYTS